jgi:hypothetical protein
MISDERIQQIIREIVQDHSGGLKFSQLVVLVLDQVHTETGETRFADFVGRLERIVRASLQLAVLEYGYDLGGVWRQKMFHLYAFAVT